MEQQFVAIVLLEAHSTGRPIAATDYVFFRHRPGNGTRLARPLPGNLPWRRWPPCHPAHLRAAHWPWSSEAHPLGEREISMLLSVQRERRRTPTLSAHRRRGCGDWPLHGSFTLGSPCRAHPCPRPSPSNCTGLASPQHTTLLVACLRSRLLQRDLDGDTLKRHTQ